MRILFTRFPFESSFGGAEVQTLSLMEGLQRHGHDIEFLGSCPVLFERVASSQWPVIRLDIGIPPVTKWGAISFLWRKRQMEKQLIAALNQLTTDHAPLTAIVMLSLTEKLLLTEEAHRRGIRVLWLEHDRVGRWLTGNPWLRELKALSGKATTVGVSHLSKRLYEELGFQHVVAIPNGIDPRRMTNDQAPMTNRNYLPGEARRAQSGQFSTLHSQFRIGCIARLTYDKGVDLLIEAIANLPDVSLAIVGQGKEERNLRSLIASSTQHSKLKTKNSITMIPSIDNLSEFYRSLDLLVLPSREHDPFGLVAAEAMMLGIPVIVTDACGIAGYLHDGTDALIVKACSREALREAINRLRDPVLRQRLAAEGERTARSCFTVEKMVDQYEKLLKGVDVQ